MDDAQRRLAMAQFKILKDALARKDWPAALRAYAWILPLLEELFENNPQQLLLYRSIGYGLIRQVRETKPPDEG